MEIKILGKGCLRCEEVERRVMNVLSELNVAADVQKIKGLKEILSYGVFSTPGLIVKNSVKSQGRIPSREEIMEWIKQELSKE